MKINTERQPQYFIDGARILVTSRDTTTAKRYAQICFTPTHPQSAVDKQAEEKFPSLRRCLMQSPVQSRHCRILPVLIQSKFESNTIASALSSVCQFARYKRYSTCLIEQP
jgi:hypothetical protein